MKGGAHTHAHTCSSRLANADTRLWLTSALSACGGVGTPERSGGRARHAVTGRRRAWHPRPGAVEQSMQSVQSVHSVQSVQIMQSMHVPHTLNSRERNMGALVERVSSGLSRQLYSALQPAGGGRRVQGCRVARQPHGLQLRPSHIPSLLYSCSCQAGIYRLMHW